MSTYQVVLRLRKRKLDADDNKYEDDPTLVPSPSKKQRMDDCKERDDENVSLCDLSSIPLEFPKRIKRVIVLNVGGIKYSTTLHTLTGYESMLKARFSGHYSMEPEEDGSYFFDRDGGLFKYILKYLRTGNLLVPEFWTQTELRALYLEVQYFAVQSMLETLSLRFFSSKILIHDVLKQEIIGKINNFECMDYGQRKRLICPTEQWKLLFDYDDAKCQDHDKTKKTLENVLMTNELSLVLLSTGGTVYGKLLHFREEFEAQLHGQANAIIFAFEKHRNFDRPVDPERSIMYSDKSRKLASAEYSQCTTSRANGTMNKVIFGSLYPLPIFSWKSNDGHTEFQVFDYMLLAGLRGKTLEQIEIWRITTRSPDV